MFLLESVILSTGGRGWALDGLPDRDPLNRDPPRQRPPWIETPDGNPMDRDPHGQTPPGWRHPWTETPWTETSQTKPPPRQETPRTATPLDRHPLPAYGKEWAVRILLECILVNKCSCVVWWLMTKTGGYAFLFKWKSKGNTEKWQISSKIE